MVVASAKSSVNRLIGPLAGMLVVAVARAASADEPVSVGEPELMKETAETTRVVDAFDRNNAFDVHFLLGFRQEWKSAKVRRETSLNQPGLSTGGFVAPTENIASYSQSRSILDLGADIGIYKDLGLTIRFPVIVSDSRELSDLDGAAKNVARRSDQDGNPIFSVPFKSPTRSGIDWFSVGLQYAVTNQRRDPSKPTWVIGGEGRFAIGPRIHACNDNAPVRCPDPVNPSLSRDPGISRGMHAVVLHTTFSRREGYVEPFVGFRSLLEIPQGNSDFGATSDLRGALLTRPPLLGTVTLGTEIFPWENKERYQRLTIDARVSGTYHSRGRDYTELFDALGSSQVPALRSGNPSSFTLASDGVRSVADPNGQRAFFNGITDQQSFGSLAMRTGATWQAGEYVRFSLGFGLTFAQNHIVTTADACNPDVKNDLGGSGPCRAAQVSNTPTLVTGIPNPHYRALIDSPGRRFSIDDTMVFDVLATGIVMF